MKVFDRLPATSQSVQVQPYYRLNIGDCNVVEVHVSKSVRSSKKVLVKKVNTICNYLRDQLYNSSVEDWPKVFQIKTTSLEHAQAVERVCRQIKAHLKG